MKSRLWCETYKEWEKGEYGVDKEGDLFWVDGPLPMAMINIDKHKLSYYIGKKDKKGAEIYEGDIIKTEKRYLQYLPGDDTEKYYYYEVKYEDCGFMPFADNYDSLPYPIPEQCEIVSNIYENPNWWEKFNG